MAVNLLIIAAVLGGTPEQDALPTLAPVATLAPNDVPPGAAGNAFGRSVAVQGNYIAVGAPGDPWYNSLVSGAVYVFRRQGNRWIELDKLTVPDAGGFEDMG